MLPSFWAGNIRSPQLHARLTTMISYLTNADPTVGIKLVPGGDFTLGQDSLYAIAQTPTCPNYAIWSYPGGTLILLGGMQNNLQLSGIVNGWLPNSNPPTQRGVNALFELAAGQIVAANRAAFLVNTGPLYIVGHSLGGAVALALPAALALAGVDSIIRVITYGMPKIGTATGILSVVGPIHIQWVLEGDPIVRCPPSLAEAPALHVLIPITVSRGMSAQRYVTNAWQITVSGVVSQVALESARQTWTYLSLAEWLISQDGFSNTSHTIREYNGAFNSAISASPLPSPSPAPIPQERIVPQTVRQRNELIAIGEALVFSDATSPTGVTRNYLVAPVLTPEAPRYRPRHIGETWVIYLGDNAVAVSTGKRAAKVLCRRWNRAARAAIPIGV